MTDLIYASEGFTTRPPSSPLATRRERGTKTGMLQHVQGPLCVSIVTIQPFSHCGHCHCCGACLEWQLTGMVVCLFV